MSTLYRIRDWDKHYETAETRKLKRLSWIPCPIKYDGTGYCLLMSQQNGPAIFGCFLALAEVAGNSPARTGDLQRSDGRPHTPASLAIILRMPEALIRETLTVLSSGEIDWIEQVPPAESAGTPGKFAVIAGESAGRIEGNRREGKGMEQKGTEQRAVAPDQPSAREASPPAALEAAEYFRLACADALGRPLDSAEDRTLAGTLMRRMAVGRIHPDIAARWARDFCERKAAAGDPVRGLKLLMHAWREDFGAWWKRVGAAYVGDRTHCVEQAVCAHCGDGVASFADGLVVPCACPPAESPPKRGLTKIAKPAKLSGRHA